MGNSPSQISPAQANQLARTLVLQNALPMEQQIDTRTFVPSGGNIAIINVRNVGIIKGFWVQVAITINNAAGVSLTPTDFGAANILQSINFTDFANNVRIQTSGLHVAMLNTVRGKRVFGSATSNDISTSAAIGVGAQYAPIVAPTIPTVSSGTATMWYYIPLAPGADAMMPDLRGAVFANVTNSTAQLTLTVNLTPAVINTGDTTNAVYTSASAINASITSCTITTYQVYLDQIPQDRNGQYLLPTLDMQQTYELKTTPFGGITAGQDFPIPFGNFRQFTSVLAVYNNNGTTGRVNGTDINYWALQAANSTNIFKKTPTLLAIQNRQKFGDDLPKGSAFFDFAARPIVTTQQGNMQLLLNSITAGASAYCQIYWEDFFTLSAVGVAGSLAGN